MAPPVFSTTPAENQTSEVALHFPHGLPGFETSRRFVLKAQPCFAPIASLESADSPDLCFLVVPVAVLVADYSLAVAPEDLRVLGLDPDRQPDLHKEALCLAILTAPAEGPVTANLLAPVVVNLAENVAVQAVRADMMYSHQYVIHTLRSAGANGEPEGAC